MKNYLKSALLLSLASLSLVACGTQKEQTSNQPTIGILQYMDHPSLDAAREGFLEGLAENGYSEKDMTIAYQNAQGDQANLQTISEQLVTDSDLILAIATPAAQALATVSTETPILFTAVTDPVSADLVDSMEKPGGLLTGTSDQAPIDKQIELLGKALPNAKTIGILYTTSERNSEVQVEVAEKLLKKAGYTVNIKGISSTNDVQDATSSLMEKVDAVFVPTDNTIASTMTLIGELSLRYKVPVVGGSTDMVDEGGLLTYGTNYKELGRQTAQLASKLLKGQKPDKLAAEYPKTVQLHINETIAQELGIDTSTLSETN